jgi:hypothetical protein
MTYGLTCVAGAHYFVTTNVPLRPLVALHVPESRVGDDGAEKLTVVPVQSEPRAVNWPAATPQSPLTAQ